MFAFIFTEVIVSLIIVGLLLVLSGVWPPDSPWAPWWQMPADVIAAMCAMAKLSPKDTIYDLGCGTGNALVHAAKKYGVKGVGIEIDPIRYWIARFNVWKLNRQYSSSKQSKERSSRDSFPQAGTIDITLLKKNFFDVSLTQATVVFVYLVPAALKRLAPKFLKEINPGTTFFSYIYPMPEKLFKGKLQLIAYNKKKKIYFYQLLAKPSAVRHLAKSKE